MRARQTVLCLQDTTLLDWNGQDIVGLGPIQCEAERGLFLHPTYTVTPNREPLGILDDWSWVRKARGGGGQRPPPGELSSILDKRRGQKRRPQRQRLLARRVAVPERSLAGEER